MIVTPLIASFISGLLGFAMFAVSLFLILLILVQRGRGGGLTGALGGPGGQSAFGTKAGDLFTRITSFVALGWIALCAFTMWLLGPDPGVQADAPGPQVTASPTDSPRATSDIIDLGTGAATNAGAASETKPAVELTPATGQAPAGDTTTPAAPGDKAAASAETVPSAPAATEQPAAPATTGDAAATEAPAAPAGEAVTN